MTVSSSPMLLVPIRTNHQINYPHSFSRTVNSHLRYSKCYNTVTKNLLNVKTSIMSWTGPLIRKAWFLMALIAQIDEAALMSSKLFGCCDSASELQRCTSVLDADVNMWVCDQNMIQNVWTMSPFVMTRRSTLTSWIQNRVKCDLIHVELSLTIISPLFLSTYSVVLFLLWKDD